jgi:hypothetical protein
MKQFVVKGVNTPWLRIEIQKLGPGETVPGEDAMDRRTLRRDVFDKDEPDADADGYGVYEVCDDGCGDFWVADFRERADAEKFALEKEKEKVK